jgi:hypothetical protein
LGSFGKKKVGGAGTAQKEACKSRRHKSRSTNRKFVQPGKRAIAARQSVVSEALELAENFNVGRGGDLAKLEDDGV